MLDTLWVVIAATLVFLMQPGFMCLESGLTRSKNSINVAVKNLADFVFSVLTFWSVGYGIMFGATTTGWFGTDSFFPAFENVPDKATFFFFQAMFCGTATTIFSGAVAERMKFSSYLIVVFILSTGIYPVFGHWAWNGANTGTPSGWLAADGFVDFAGSTVVHSIGGWTALATLLVIGPRAHRFDENSNFFGFNGSNLPLSVLGTCLLWIGWVGFNGGSTLAMDSDVPRIIVYTTLAGAAGAFANLFIGWIITKIPRVTFLTNGSLGGLVAITAGCHCVTAPGAICIGLVAGILCFATEIALIRLKIDDAVGAIPVHLACGIWGTLAVAIFGNPELIGTGLSATGQFIVQLKGIIAAFLFGFLLPLLLINTINRFFPLRVSAEEEHNGLNFSEHGATTELVELCQAMDRQVTTKDFSVRMPVEPFTEVGLIAARHNQVMDALESALSKTEIIVNLAKDAIITFAKDTLEIININPRGLQMFGLEPAVATNSGVSLPDLFDSADFVRRESRFWMGDTIETVGRKAGGGFFPIQAVITSGGLKSNFYIGTFRDITDLKQRERSLVESELRYREFFENIGVAALMINANATIAMVNREAEQLFGFKRQQMQHGMTFYDITPKHEHQRLELLHRQRQLSQDSSAQSFETQVVHSTGTIMPVFVSISNIPHSSRSIATVIDMSELRQAQVSLARQKAYFFQLFEGSSQAIIALDKNRKILNANKGFEQLFGYRESDILGRNITNIIIPEDRNAEIAAISTTVLSGSVVREETIRLHRDGRAIPVSLLGFPITINNSLEGFFFIYEDISERKSFENQLYQQAFFDGLTSIPNRILFMERLNRALERKKRKSSFRYAVLLIDIDRFKWVNDSLGHLAGDELLQRLARNFLKCVRSSDTVARLGGDEFAILIEEFDNPRTVTGIAERIQLESQRPYLIGNNDVQVSASIGIVLNTDTYSSTEAIVRDADIAMYRAKELGKARFQIFNKKLHKIAFETLQMESELREAIGRHLAVHYQPVVAGTTHRVLGFEALVRWDHPERGLIPPNRFVPIAEETGLIIPLGEWVLEEACRQLKFWQETIPGAENLMVAVNISAKQFLQGDLVVSVTNILARTELEPKNLKIELTESTIMEGGQLAIDRLRKLKNSGVTLAIDDFGTGYSSLSSLQRFPIDDLKIDRSFISAIEHREEDQEIVKTIITLAKTLQLSVVAEGVENDEQRRLLERFDCDALQGFLFSPPVPAPQIPGIIGELGT